MIIINDEQRLLNLNHMAIYLMLTQDEKACHEEKLKRLNKYSTLTRGLFHFDIIEKGDTPYEELPKDMIRNMRHYNVLVRLVNSIHGIYCYGMEDIELNAEMPAIVDELKSFVDAVCKENVKQLDILCNRHTSTSISAMKMYRDNNIVRDIFEAALEGDDVDASKAKTLLEKTTSSTDMGTSLGIASSAADAEKEKAASKIEKERCEREKPFERPSITMTVKYVKTGKVFKNGREQKKLGVELNIDGDSVPVWFGSTDQTFLYIATIMACAEGRTIKRSDFQPVEKLIAKNSSGEKAIREERKEIITWLSSRFSTLSFDQRFDTWYKGVIAYADAHPLNVALGVIRKKLWNFLCLQHKNAYYYSFVVNEKGGYKIRGISKNNIKIDPRLQERAEDIDIRINRLSLSDSGSNSAAE